MDHAKFVPGKEPVQQRDWALGFATRPAQDASEDPYPPRPGAGCSKTRAASGVRSPEVPSLTLPPYRSVAPVGVSHAYKTHCDPGTVTFPVRGSRARPTCEGLPRA